jgi:hypothetical protein
MNKFHEVSDKYEKVVSMCKVEAGNASAEFLFRDGRKKRFKTPDEAERYILSKYRIQGAEQ